MLHPCIAKVKQNWTHFLTSEAHKEGFRTSEGPARSNQNTKRLDFEPFGPPRLDFEPFSPQDPPGIPRSPRSPHGTNLCIEVGFLSRCRRGPTVQKAPSASLGNKLVGSHRTNIRIEVGNFKGGQRGPKVLGDPRVAGFGPVG